MENNKDQEQKVMIGSVPQDTIKNMKLYSREEIIRYGKISDFLSYASIPLHFAPLLLLLFPFKALEIHMLLSIVLSIPALLLRLFSMLYALKSSTRIATNALKTIDAMGEIILDLDTKNQDLRIALRALTASSDTGEERMKN